MSSSSPSLSDLQRAIRDTVRLHWRLFFVQGMIILVLGFLAIQAERSRMERVLEILDDEFTTIMRQVGALNIYQITRDTVTHT